MTRKQKSKGFSKFLDMIGLVNDENDMEGDFDAGIDEGRGKVRGGRSSGFEDEFAEEPRMSRAQPRRDRTQANGNSSAQKDRFDADEGWNTNTSGRPQYGARTQQRAQSTAKNADRYGNGGSAPQGGRSANKYDAGQTRDGSYGRASSSYGTYQRETPRGGYAGSSDAYGSYYGGYQEENSYGAGSRQEQPAANGGYHRHQTIIFKLKSVDECKDVIKALIDKKSVLLNLDELDTLQTQRTIDTMCGATYAIGATLSRASDRTWLITPNTVEVADSHAEAGGSYGGRYI